MSCNLLFERCIVSTLLELGFTVPGFQNGGKMSSKLITGGFLRNGGGALVGCSIVWVVTIVSKNPVGKVLHPRSPSQLIDVDTLYHFFVWWKRF